MFRTGQFATFLLVSLAIIAGPGPSVLFVVSRGVALGRRAAVATAVGNEVGLCVQVAAVAFGLGAVVERFVVVFAVVKLIGAGYLVFLGVQAFRHRAALSAATDPTVTVKRLGQILREGAIVGVTNPKSLLLFAAILPQFADPARGHVPLQLMALGLVCVLVALVSDSLWGLLAGTARIWLGRSKRRLEALGGAAGLVMVGLGLRLALTRQND